MFGLRIAIESDSAARRTWARHWCRVWGPAEFAGSVGEHDDVLSSWALRLYCGKSRSVVLDWRSKALIAKRG